MMYTEVVYMTVHVCVLNKDKEPLLCSTVGEEKERVTEREGERESTVEVYCVVP